MALRLETTPPDPDGKKAELTEHLAELRTRIIRACLYVGVGMVVMYAFSMPIYAQLSAPLVKQGHVSFLFTNAWDPFFLRLQLSTVGGLILALPFVVLELWGFIAPALTATEKKGFHFVAPLSVLLFALGVGCAYFILPFALKWFLGYIQSFPGAVLLQNPLTYVVFVVKIMLVFGVMFELPVVLMFLGKIGILSSAIMIKYWRYIAVGLFTTAMVVAPSNDPGTMLALAIPLTLLFFASIGLVKMVEPKPPQS